MALLMHLGHHRAHPLARAARPEPEATAEQAAVNARVFAVQRAGAVLVALILLTFGLLVFTSGVPFLSSQGERFLGLSADGLLAAVSVVVAGILVGAALRGPRVASTIMLVVGALFLVSALVNLAVLGTGINLFAFQMSNVVFSVVVGLLLLVLGGYGRFSGNLPVDSPYAYPRAVAVEPPELPSTPEEVAAEAAMRAAEIAVVQHYATEDQRRRVAAMAGVYTRDGRRRVWMAFDRPAGDTTDPTRLGRGRHAA